MVDIFKALSEESRLRILTVLLNGEMCVCEIELCLNMTQSNVSRHMTVLKQCGILESYKKAQWSYFRVAENFKVENKELWSFLLRKLKELPSYKKDCTEQEKCKNQNLCYNKNNCH